MYTHHMAFHVSSETVDKKVRRLAALTGQSITDTIDSAVTKELRRMEPRKPDPNYVEDLLRMADEIGKHVRPGIKSTDDLVGYDEYGLP